MLAKYGDTDRSTFDSPITAYIWQEVMGNGDFGDEDVSNGFGDGMARFGKRILWWTDQDFVYSSKWRTEALAMLAFDTARSEYETEEEEPARILDDPDFPAGVTVQHSRYGGVAWAVLYVEDDMVVCCMVGDDCLYHHDKTDLTLIADDDYCGGCGQIGCKW